MSLTRKMLKAMDIDEEKISQIFDAHQETIDEISKERDGYKTELDTAKAELKRRSDVEKELVKANAKLDEAKGMEQKLADLKKEYDDFKAEIDAKNVTATKAKTYKELLLKQGIPEKYHDAIIRVTDLESVELKEGKIVNEKDIIESIDKDWVDFKVTESKQGAKTPNPPSSNGGDTFEKMSLADKMAYANEHPDAEEVKAWLK